MTGVYDRLSRPRSRSRRGARHAQCTVVVFMVHGFNVSRAVPASAGANHGDYLPAVSEVFNVHQGYAARFAGSMLGGIAPLANG
jgi:hypothetical protein